MLARRFDVAENHSEIAVLTAQSINPNLIAPPFIAHKATIKLHKIIGVLFDDSDWNAPSTSAMEISECGGEANLSNLVASTLGLVKVEGQSAVPRALHGQYLIIREEMHVTEALKTLVGKPVIAEDSHDNRYFKRLQRPSGDKIVLESLDGSGDYEPIILSPSETGKNFLKRVWPVSGVLFEIP